MCAKVLEFSNDPNPGPSHPAAPKPGSQSKLAVISCRGTDDLDARLQQAADGLHLTKSQLVHDIAERFLAQTGRQGLRQVSKLERAQRTRELARELFELWWGEPESTRRAA
jgi:hypothetical protein